MSNGLNNFWRIAEVIIPIAVELSVYSGVPFGGCSCPNSISVMRMGHACCTVMNILPVLHSAA